MTDGMGCREWASGGRLRHDNLNVCMMFNLTEMIAVTKAWLA